MRAGSPLCAATHGPDVTGADALPTEALSAIRCCTADGAAVPSPTLGSGRTHYDPGSPKIDGGKSWFGEQHSCTSVCAKEVYDDPSKYMVTDSGFVPYLRQETPVHDALAATYAEAAAECAAHEGWRLCTRAELALTDDKDDPAYCVGTACSANERCSKYKGYKQSRRDACFSQLVWSSDVCTDCLLYTSPSPRDRG